MVAAPVHRDVPAAPRVRGGLMAPGERTGRDRRPVAPAALGVRVRVWAYGVAREVRWDGKVVLVGAGTWLISLELATP